MKYCYLKVLYANPDPQVRQAAYEEMERWTTSFVSSAEKIHSTRAYLQLHNNERIPLSKIVTDCSCCDFVLRFLEPFSQIKSISLPTLPLLTHTKTKPRFYQPIPPPSLLHPTAIQSRPPPAIIPPLPLPNQSHSKVAPAPRYTNDDPFGEQRPLQQPADEHENQRGNNTNLYEASRNKQPQNEFDETDENPETRTDLQHHHPQQQQQQQQNVTDPSLMLSPHEQRTSTECMVELENEDSFSSKHSSISNQPSRNSVPNENAYQARALAKFAQWQLARYDAHLDEVVVFLSLSFSFFSDIELLFICWIVVIVFLQNVIHQLLMTSKLAIEKDSDWYKAWHIWAIVHYRVRIFFSIVKN